MADVHLGAWRDPTLSSMNIRAFERSMDICIEEGVDFIIISGDLFDTSMPSFDVIDTASKKLNEVKRAGIRVYVVPGSHDSSPSGKTILKLLENTELIVNVAKGDEVEGKLRLRFVEDPSGVKITGMFGKRGALERQYFQSLDPSIGSEPGYKIFVFHSGISEFLPDYLRETPTIPLSLLPEGFDYYAGGHIHQRSEHHYGKGLLVYPGPLFPENFLELERFGSGGFYIVEERPRFVDLKEAEVVVLSIDATGKTAKRVEAEIEKRIHSITDDSFILLIRVSGVLGEGRPVDINFRRLTEEAYRQGARVVTRNTNALTSREYRDIRVSVDTLDGIEERVIREKTKDPELVRSMMSAFNIEKEEGETNQVFEDRVNAEGYALLRDHASAIQNLNKPKT